MKRALFDSARWVGRNGAGGVVMMVGLTYCGCGPGRLPCDREEWKEICNGGGNPRDGSPPEAGPGPDETLAALGDRPLSGCAPFATVRAMDPWFARRCGESLCHVNKAVGDLKQPGIWMRILTTQSSTCPGATHADRTDYKKGVIWLKTSDAPTCLEGDRAGKSAGVKMPPTPGGSPDQSLTPEEKSCLEIYLKALTN